MKVVLFCGGLGLRIREYSESIPKPMIPIGQKPILWHVMDYYSRYGHRDFVLCLGYKANTVRQFFLGDDPQVFSDLVISEGGRTVGTLGGTSYEDWRVTLIDTGVSRSIGERLFAVREHVNEEDIFCANYSDGLTDADLDEMLERFKASGKVASFLAVRPPVTYHIVDVEADGRVRDIRPADRADVWINGGFFLFRPQIFDYMREGEELVVEPFHRLIDDNQLMAFKHDGFFRAMDTQRDRQELEEMFDKGAMPWRTNRAHAKPKV